MQIVKREGVFRLYDRQATLILTDEKQLARIAERPDLPLFDDEERGFSGEKKGLYPPGTTLDSFMRDAQARGCTRVEVSYDFFFGGSARENYPDSPLTLAAYKVICDCAAKYGMAFGASLVSPLDLGGGYVKTHNDRGHTWQIEEGAIENGAYRVTMRRQRQWYNNKGPIQLIFKRAMALAFSEEIAENGRDMAVDIQKIEDISNTARVCADESKYKLTSAGYAYDEMTVYGETDSARERVLIIAEYETPEQDYFAPDALDYIKSVIDAHAARGIRYQGFYSDEMHIQFDWDLSEHFGPTEIRTRYVTDSLIEAFAERYGAQYRDFAKYMVYFAYAPHEYGIFRSHIMGRDARSAAQTVLFRKRYFEMLSERIVQLSMDAKKYAESLFGAPIMTRAHATWQESPTCDHFSKDFAFSENNRAEVSRYDYDTPYVWSSTIRENMSACGDYFRWNAYLTGSGTDHPEGGNADRDYYAQAFACSLGALNDYDRAYCACWGSPAPVARRFSAVGAAYGTGNAEHAVAQDFTHRISDILVLYPTQLNYAEERFGSWMVQYGYCDYITQEKLIEFAASSDDGLMHVKNRRYRAVVALFEPFLDARARALLLHFAKCGGRLIWAGPPALYDENGEDASEEFMEAFGLARATPLCGDLREPAMKVFFEGALYGVASMWVRTAYLPDALYPVEPARASIAARTSDHIVGTFALYGEGFCIYLGFRPRDDQSQSTGEDVSTLFDILRCLGAYAPGSMEAASRPQKSRCIGNRFANGAMTVANHYRTFYEDWYGSFFRDAEKDEALLQGRALPPIEIDVDGDIGGRFVQYRGTDALTFRLNERYELTAFAGDSASGITIDGKHYEFFPEKASIAFSIMDKTRLPENISHLLLVKCDRPGAFTLPLPRDFPVSLEAGVCELDFYETAEALPVKAEGGILTVDIPERAANRWIGVYKRAQ